MVQLEDIGRLLCEHPFFAGMDDGCRTFLAGCAANEVFRSGEFVFREGGAADKFYVIRHGRVSLEVDVPGGEPVVLDALEKGDVLGWSWILPPYRWAFDARALELTRLTSLDAACLRGKMESDHELGYELYKRFMPVVADRLRSARFRLVDMYGPVDDKRRR